MPIDPQTAAEIMADVESGVRISPAFFLHDDGEYRCLRCKAHEDEGHTADCAQPLGRPILRFKDEASRAAYDEQMALVTKDKP